MSSKLSRLKKRLVCSRGCTLGGEDQSVGQEGQQTPVTQSSENGDGMTATSVRSSEQREDAWSSDSVDEDEVAIAVSWPDFGRHLPYIPWVCILSCLNERDRLAVATTCSRLWEVSLDPSLWKSFEMILGRVTEEQRNLKYKVKLQATEKTVLRRSSRFVKKVTIWVEDVKKLKFSKESLKVLREATKTWELTSVHLNGCKHSRGNRESYRLPSSIRELVVNFLTSQLASGLKELHVRVWPWLDKKEDSSILNILKDATFFDSLIDLSLHLVTPFTRYLSPLVEDCLAVTSIVGKFRMLRKLAISAPYVTDDLLKALSDPQHCPLQVFHVSEGDFQHEVTAWPSLLSFSPELEVSIVARKRFVHSSFRHAVPPTVPLVHCYLGTHVSRHEQKHMLLLLPDYAAHLKSIEARCSDQAFTDNAAHLLETVTKCRHVQNITFFGQVTSATIAKLATMERGWGTFQFLAGNITFPEGGSGTREQKITRLCLEVSSKLGSPWLPSRITGIPTVPSSTIQADGNRVVGLRVMPVCSGL